MPNAYDNQVLGCCQQGVERCSQSPVSGQPKGGSKLHWS